MDSSDFDRYVMMAREHNASDIHFTAGLPPMVRIGGELLRLNPEILDYDAVNELLESILSEKQKKEVSEGKDVDFAYVTSDGYRNRVNVYKQRGSLCAAVRILRDKIPTLESLNMPKIMEYFAMLPRGIVLITGPTGSGKSTTLAALINYINTHRSVHVITIEDPIEYLHRHKMSMINQREIGRDTTNFSESIRAALREDPDVLLVGEMRDYETISAALTAAETGHLVFSTLHTNSAATTIDRIIDVFPEHQQPQIRTQLASVLRGIVSQQLIRRKGTKDQRLAVLEILVANDAVANIIRENKCHQINSFLQTSGSQGMQSFDAHLAQLVKNNEVALDDALLICHDEKMLRSFLSK